jgi:hypothetical protein
MIILQAKAATAMIVTLRRILLDFVNAEMRCMAITTKIALAKTLAKITTTKIAMGLLPMTTLLNTTMRGVIVLLATRTPTLDQNFPIRIEIGHVTSIMVKRNTGKNVMILATLIMMVLLHRFPP